MKIKTVNLDWRVLNYDWNQHKVIDANVFYSDTPERIAKEIRSGRIKSKEDLHFWLNREFQYHYWSRAEYEIMVGDLGAKLEDLEKIDVYRQLKMNMDRIVDYVIQKMEIKFDTGK